MTKKLNLTLACGDYEIVRPLKEGIVQADGIELNVLTKANTTRHWRFLTTMSMTSPNARRRPISRRVIAECRFTQSRCYLTGVSGHSFLRTHQKVSPVRRT